MMSQPAVYNGVMVKILPSLLAWSGVSFSTIMFLFNFTDSVFCWNVFGQKLFLLEIIIHIMTGGKQAAELRSTSSHILQDLTQKTLNNGAYTSRLLEAISTDGNFSEISFFKTITSAMDDDSQDVSLRFKLRYKMSRNILI